MRRTSEANLAKRNSTASLNGGVNGMSEKRWIFQGRSDLVDLDVVVGRASQDDDETSFDVLSHEESFTVHTSKKPNTI